MARGQRWFLSRCLAIIVGVASITGVVVGLGQVLPGSGIIAYTNDTDGIADIYMLDVVRLNHLNITRTPLLSEERPTWSFDGARLAYERRVQAAIQLCILEIGGQNRCYDPYGFFDNSPVWSPDGRWIAFNSAGSEGGNLFILNVETGEVQSLRLITEEVRKAYSWSPDSTRLVFSEYRTDDGYVELSIYNRLTGEVQHRLPDYVVTNLVPIWSPKGQQIAFMSDSGYAVYGVNADDDTPPRQLTPEPGYNLSLSWSPDSSELLLVSAGGGSDFDLFLIDVETGEMRLLTDNDALDERPTWSPDGRQIAFTSDRDGDGIHIYVMNVDGSDVRRLTFAAGRNTDPAWRP